MEGNKSAMYEQAGRNRGWTQGFRDEKAVTIEKQAAVQVSRVTTETPAAPVVIVAPAAAVPVAVPMPTESVAAPIMPAIPVMPGVPVIPAPPVVSVPEMEKPAEACQTLAMAYITMQKWRELYEPEQGISRGTIFAELDLPFVGEGACRHE